MIRFRSVGGGLALLLAMTSLAAAQTQKPDDPSVYLRCDGNPPHMSVGEGLGRALLLTATLGMAGLPEMQDASKRAHGSDGVNSCDVALQQEVDPIRKVRLMLARSIHHIEMKDYAAALDDARTAPSMAGVAAQDIGFRHSLYLSSLDLQAAALIRQGHFPEAEAMALQMAVASPYDVVAQVRAAPYVALTAESTPEKQEYLDRLIKIFPLLMPYRAVAFQWAGQYREAASVYAHMLDLQAGFSADNIVPPQPAVLAVRSVMLALAGRMEESNALAADVTAMIRVLNASGKATLMQAAIDNAEQSLDFQAIIADLAAGHADAARAKVSARSHWSQPAVPAVSDLVGRLRQGAAASALTGSLATDAATMRADGLTANAGAITEADNADAMLYNDIRPSLDAGTYRAWVDDIWNTKSSVFLHKRASGENYVGEIITVPRVPTFFSGPHLITSVAGEALLLHAALLAQARGAKAFVLFPARQQLETILLRFGNPGDPDMPASVCFDAATVIADLSGEFPDPRVKDQKAVSAPVNQ